MRPACRIVPIVSIHLIDDALPSNLLKEIAA
jgi:hypothetical protein